MLKEKDTQKPKNIYIYVCVMKVLEDTFSLIYVPTCFSLKCRLSAARRPPTTRLYGVKGLLFRRFVFFSLYF